MRRYSMSAGAMWAAGLAVLGLTALSGCGPKYPNCDNDDDCHAGEFCVDGHCQQCRPDGNDCPAGQECVGGACRGIAGWCNSDGDCPSGQQCRNNQCVAGQMSTPIDTPPVTGCQMSAVYFAYDSSELESSARDGIQANANCIRERSVSRVHVTGHCDPRGTEEYNLALGDRRARAVQRYLNSLGTNAQITVSSMGEEMARGTSEATWSRDRRVEFTQR